MLIHNHWWLVRVTLVVPFDFLPQNFGWSRGLQIVVLLKNECSLSGGDNLSLTHLNICIEKVGAKTTPQMPLTLMIVSEFRVYMHECGCSHNLLLVQVREGVRSLGHFYKTDFNFPYFYTNKL